MCCIAFVLLLDVCVVGCVKCIYVYVFKGVCLMMFDVVVVCFGGGVFDDCVFVLLCVEYVECW